MKELLNRVIVQLDKLDDKLDSVDKTIIKQEENLREHMRRTEIAEKRIENLSEDLEPIQNHVNQVRGGFKILAYVVPIIVTLIGTIWKLYFN